MKKQSGFTLIELALIIIIITFFLQWMLHHDGINTDRKIKLLENEFHGIVAAMYSYQDRYRTLPGDVNGDGKITGTFDSTTDGDESRLFWLHLRQVGLIQGEPYDQQQPFNTFGGKIGVATNLSISDSDSEGISGLFIGFSQIPGEQAIIIESRSDDNNPNTGIIQAHKLVFGRATPIKEYSTSGLYNLYFAL